MSNNNASIARTAGFIWPHAGSTVRSSLSIREDDSGAAKFKEWVFYIHHIYVRGGVKGSS